MIPEIDLEGFEQYSARISPQETTSMSDTPRGLPLTSSRVERIFPKLTPEQISRVAVQGHIRVIQPGELLVEQGDIANRFLWWCQVE